MNRVIIFISDSWRYVAVIYYFTSVKWIYIIKTERMNKIDSSHF